MNYYVYAINHLNQKLYFIVQKIGKELMVYKIVNIMFIQWIFHKIVNI